MNGSDWSNNAWSRVGSLNLVKILNKILTPNNQMNVNNPSSCHQCVPNSLPIIFAHGFQFVV